MSKTDPGLNTPSSPGAGVARGDLAVFERSGGSFPDQEAFETLAQTTTPVGFWTWDVTTGTVWHSAEQYRIHGLAPGALGETLEDYLAFVHPDDRARIEEGALAAAAGENSGAEYRFVHPEGGVRHLVGTSAVVRDGSGKIQRLVGTVQDVTAVTRARRSLSEAFSRLSAYFDETPTPAYLWRREGDELYLRRLNKAARQQWGDHVDNLLGAPASEVCADMPEVVADICQCLETQTAVRRETSRKSPRLGERRLIVTYVPVAPDAVVAHAEDISELVEAGRREEAATSRLAEYFLRVPTPAYLWRNRDGEVRLEAANVAAERATAGDVSDLIGITAEEMYAGRPDIIDDIHRALRGETFTREMPYRMRFSERALDLVVTYVHIPPDVVAVHTRDVTQQRLMEAALRDSHEASRGVLDACSQPIILIDSAGRVLETNDAAGHSLGVPRAELVGALMYDHFPASLVEGRRAAVAEVIRTGRAKVIEDTHDGRTYRARLYPLADGANGVERVVIYAEDVTEERRSHDALLRSRERLEEAQRIGHLGHWDLDPEAGGLTCSDELFRIFGLEPAAEASLEQFVERVHPEDRERMIRTVRGALETGEPYHLEYRVQHPDGSVRFVFEQGELKAGEDVARVMTGTVLDITELRTAEQSIRDRETEMSTIIERNPDGICLIVAGRISICNGSMARLVGCTKEAIEGQALHDLMIPEDRARARERGRVILSGGEPEPHEYTLQRCDETRIPVEIYGTAFEFRGGPALICTLRDVSKRKQAEHDLAESRDALRALTQHLESVREQERVQVARDLHDELGSILTALKIDVAEIGARDGAEDEEALVAEMSKLLDQAIEVGRRITTRLRPGILDDLGLAAAAEWLGRDLERRTGVKCEVVLPECEPELPEPVATTMFRILQEAVTNVIRHADADAVEIVLDADEETVSLRVSDTGKGFDPAAARGQSFGLLGMRERARAFAGSIEVESAPGEGTTVRVTLPRRPDTPTN